MRCASGVHVGVPFTKDDGSQWILAYAHAALVAYTPYLVVPSINTEDLDRDGSADNDGKAITAVPATAAKTAQIKRRIAVPQKAYAIGELAELQIGGAGKVMTTSGAVVAGDYLEVINAGTAAIDAGAETTEAFALACSANGSAAIAVNVQFLGKEHYIAAA
jgi:hypothetical protein